MSATFDASQLYGPNDHTFEEARDETGAVRRNKDGHVLAVISKPGLGPEADAVLLAADPREMRTHLDAERTRLEAERAELEAQRAEFRREYESLPADVRRKLKAVSGDA